MCSLQRLPPVNALAYLWPQRSRYRSSGSQKPRVNTQLWFPTRDLVTSIPKACLPMLQVGSFLASRCFKQHQLRGTLRSVHPSQPTGTQPPLGNQGKRCRSTCPSISFSYSGQVAIPNDNHLQYWAGTRDCLVSHVGKGGLSDRLVAFYANSHSFSCLPRFNPRQ